jgi:hypothetical protein
VEQPPHCREVIRPRKARTARRERGGREKERRAVEEPPHSREDIRPRNARRARAVEEPLAAFHLSL